MKKINTKLLALCVLILTVCACQPPELHHVVVNTTDENLTLKYKLAICGGGGDSWGRWNPETQSEADFKKAGTWTSLRDGEYALEKGNEAGAVPNSSLKANCNTETYSLTIAPHTAIKIHKGDYGSARAINLLELNGQKGGIKYEGAAPLIMENFKSYDNDWFDFFGYSLAVLWY